MLHRIIDTIFPPNESKAKSWLKNISIVLFALYVFSIPTFSNNYPYNYLSIFLCAAMCIAMSIYIAMYGKFIINSLVALLIVFNLVILTTHIINENMYSFPKTIVLLTIVAFILYNFFLVFENKSVVLYIILFISIVFSIVFIIHYKGSLFDFLDNGFSRLGSDFDNENEIAKEISIFFLISLSLMLTSKKKLLNALFLLPLLLFLFLLLATGSISNLLTVSIISFICIVLAQKTIKARIIISLIAVSVVALFIIVIQLPSLSYFKTRIVNIFSTLFAGGKSADDGSTYSRLQAALLAIKVSLYKLCWGYGYMSATDYTVTNLQAHNNFVELLIDFGIFGFLVYQTIALKPLLNYNKCKTPFLILPIALYMFVFQLFLTMYYKKFEYILYPYLFATLDKVFTEKYVLYDSSYLKRKKCKKTIFEIIPSLSPVGGAETFVADFVSTLKNKYESSYNIMLIILYKQQDSSLLSKIKESGVTVIELNKKKGLDISCSLKLRELILSYNPVVIHTHLQSFVALKIAKFIKRKDMLFVHTIHQNYSGLNKKEKIMFHLIKTNYIIPICVAIGPSLNYGKIVGRSIKYIDNGVNVKKYDSSIPLYKRKNDFLMVGRFVDIKNHKYLLQIIKDHFNDEKYNFIFLGEGPLFDDCKKYVEDNRLNASISFDGVVDNVNEYMANSKILVIPSKNEGNPIVVNEAFASGMAVVGNDVGGLHDMLVDVTVGGMVPLNNEQEFAKLALDTLNTIKNKRIKNIDYSFKTFDINKTVEQYMEVFGLKYEGQ